MTAFTPETPDDVQSRLAQLLLSLHLEGVESVRLRVFGRELVMEGWVPRYELKSRIEKAARSAGFRTQNCLRIIPGAVFRPAGPSQTSAVTDVQPPI